MNWDIKNNQHPIMARLDKLDDVLFPVDEHPVFVSYSDRYGERRLPVPDKKAIVDGNNQRVLCIVGQGHRLVTNREALDLAHQCCLIAFPETQPGEWEVDAADAPATGSYCHIDLRHNSTALDFHFVPLGQRPDAFSPFVRVTNSYNGKRPLAFDLGFHRKSCNNGLIIPDTVLHFSFTRDRQGLREGICFDVEHERLAKLKTNYIQLFGQLHSSKVRRADFEPLLRAVMRVRQPNSLAPDGPLTRDWQKLNAGLGEMCDRYAADMGENAYAVFNAITDFASRPPVSRYVRRDRHSFQRLAGKWLESFSLECLKPEFSLADYIHILEHAKPESRDEKAVHRD